MVTDEYLLSTRSLLVASHGSGRGTWFVLGRGGSSGSLRGLHLAGMKFSTPYLVFSDTTCNRGGGVGGALLQPAKHGSSSLYLALLVGVGVGPQLFL